ncbi:hypothetical protein TNCT_435331 [Trichonephila clavata]|uniref:Uncharacterized protein n=1 Tax=Trichonephila clavata TaxID=2740835 RepID=A0A8X6K769_TRICU|nr:hypothetical protein TNCT_435331 [Trichonephila clavata]
MRMSRQTDMKNSSSICRKKTGLCSLTGEVSTPRKTTDQPQSDEGEKSGYEVAQQQDQECEELHIKFSISSAGNVQNCL